MFDWGLLVELLLFLLFWYTSAYSRLHFSSFFVFRASPTKSWKSWRTHIALCGYVCVCVCDDKRMKNNNNNAMTGTYVCVYRNTCLGKRRKHHVNGERKFLLRRQLMEKRWERGTRKKEKKMKTWNSQPQDCIILMIFGCLGCLKLLCWHLSDGWRLFHALKIHSLSSLFIYSFIHSVDVFAISITVSSSSSSSSFFHYYFSRAYCLCVKYIWWPMTVRRNHIVRRACKLFFSFCSWTFMKPIRQLRMFYAPAPVLLSLRLSFIFMVCKNSKFIFKNFYSRWCRQ